MNGVHQGTDMIHRRTGQDAVPEIEKVARPPGRLIQNRVRAAPNLRRRGKQHCRIEIALNRDVIPDRRPGLGQLCPGR